MPKCEVHFAVLFHFDDRKFPLNYLQQQKLKEKGQEKFPWEIRENHSTAVVGKYQENATSKVPNNKRYMTCFQTNVQHLAVGFEQNGEETFP